MLPEQKMDGKSRALYGRLLQDIVSEAGGQKGLLGMLLIGSFARGDALPGSDLDLRLFFAPGHTRRFVAEVREGILIERGSVDVESALAKLATNPMEVYAYLDGRILSDPEGVITQLAGEARERFAAYRTPVKERSESTYWLESVRIKVRAALNAGDTARGAYLVSTASWPLLTGLWAANDKPLPPNGSVWPHLKDLTKTPPDLEVLLQGFFGGETRQRMLNALTLIDWIIEALRVEET